MSKVLELLTIQTKGATHKSMAELLLRSSDLVAYLRGFFRSFEQFQVLRMFDDLLRVPCEPIVNLLLFCRRVEKTARSKQGQPPAPLDCEIWNDDIWDILSSMSSESEVWTTLADTEPGKCLASVLDWLRSDYDRMSYDQKIDLVAPVTLLERYYEGVNPQSFTVRDRTTGEVIVQKQVPNTREIVWMYNPRTKTFMTSATIPTVSKFPTGPTFPTGSTIPTGPKFPTFPTAVPYDEADEKTSAKKPKFTELQEDCYRTVPTTYEANAASQPVTAICRKIAPKNISNSCYINSFLFSLCHLNPNPIVDFLLSRPLNNSFCNKDKALNNQVMWFPFMLFLYQKLINGEPVTDELLTATPPFNTAIPNVRMLLHPPAGLPPAVLSNMNLALCYFRRFLSRCRESEASWTSAAFIPERVFEEYVQAMSLASEQYMIPNLLSQEEPNRLEVELDIYRELIPDIASVIDTEPTHEILNPLREYVIESFLEDQPGFAARAEEAKQSFDPRLPYFVRLEDELANDQESKKPYTEIVANPDEYDFLVKRRVLANMVTDRIAGMELALRRRVDMTPINTHSPVFFMLSINRGIERILPSGQFRMEKSFDPVDIQLRVETEKHAYTLVSVIRHMDEYFHYICYFLCNGHWYEMNDLPVKIKRLSRPVNEDDVVKRNCTLLVYVREDALHD